MEKVLWLRQPEPAAFELRWVFEIPKSEAFELPKSEVFEFLKSEAFEFPEFVDLIEAPETLLKPVKCS
jgi:hypothetical protein